MDDKRDVSVGERARTGDSPDSSASKKTWEEPKLAFVEPKLTRHGNLEKLTRGSNGFFGQFSP